MNKNKVIFDIIHGFIELDDLTLSIVDTPEFQRLRNIKQLGAVHYVFPSANHTRFEHSLGVYHLAGELIKTLKNNQPELEITNKEIQLVKIAGLCHDLGHGPFSHLFDNFIEKESSYNKIHELRSISILKYLVKKNDINLDSKDIDLISQLIYPNNLDFSKINKNRHFLYEIVSNYRNGIDVDKFDYLKRDTFYLGLSFSLDCSRIIKHIRVIDGKLCYLDKTYHHILEMFEIRNKLHKQVYKHKTVIAIEILIEKIFEKLHNLALIIDNPILFCRLDDYNIFDIMNYNLDFKNNVENDILNIKYRNLYKLILESNDFIEKDGCIIKKFYFGYKKNPLCKVFFYNRNNINRKITILKNNLLLQSETIYRYYIN